MSKNISQNILQTFKDVPEAIKDKMDSKCQLVQDATNIFKNIYSNAVKPTYISQIVNGEIINTSEDNIFIDEDIETDPEFIEAFNKMQKYCTKTLYPYQQQAIAKLVQLEKRGYNINRSTKDKIISNGWLLSLPIGSGKSCVFEFLAMFFRDVPKHPIIISTDGQNIDKVQHINFDKYPFYYENCGYIEKDVNSVVVMEGYEYRKMTVILTHGHLIEQMRTYFEQDFPQLTNPKKPLVSITYANSMFNVDVDKTDILVIEASTENVKHLVQLSYNKPFMRVIIDDYTSMNDIETFRQILAPSTIFVSGSKFQRAAADIPPSYYTLKHVSVNQLSIVGHPEDTLQGILRDNIATFKLMGNSCEFNTYSFVANVENICRSRLGADPLDCYPILTKSTKIKNYLSLMFIIDHIGSVKLAINNVENALKRGKLKPEEISYYLEWKTMMKNPDVKPPTEIVEINGKKVKKLLSESVNPLYNYIYGTNSVPKNIDGNPVVTQKCYICGATPDKHLHYGMIATCCGAFICSKCLHNCSTHYITNSETGENICDEHNDYCVCCREKNPTYIFNVNHKKNTTNVHSYYLANEYFDISKLNNHQLFDYYFYMCLEGFRPKYQEGTAINIKKDIELNIIPSTIFKDNLIPDMDKLLPIDHLSLLSIYTINRTYHDLKILPRKGSTLLVYNCPIDMQDRVRNYFKNIITTNDKNTALMVQQVNSQNTKPVPVQPLQYLSLEFKSRVSDLIGLHKNIVAIIQWSKPEREDEVAQLIGRCLRLNSFNNKLYFYITTSSTEFD